MPKGGSPAPLRNITHGMGEIQSEIDDHDAARDAGRPDRSPRRARPQLRLAQEGDSTWPMRSSMIVSSSLSFQGFCRNAFAPALRARSLVP